MKNLKKDWLFEDNDYPNENKMFKTKGDAIFHAMMIFGFSITKIEKQKEVKQK